MGCWFDTDLTMEYVHLIEICNLYDYIPLCQKGRFVERKGGTCTHTFFFLIEYQNADALLKVYGVRIFAHTFFI